MRLLMRASFNRYTGYGNDAVDIARFLAKHDVDVTPWPTNLMPGLPEDFLKLLVGAPRKGDNAYDVTLQFMPPFDLRISGPPPVQNISNLGLPVMLAEKHYGWSMWEKDRLTVEDMRGHGIGQSPWKLLTAMYVTTRMNVKAFQNYEPRIEYRVMPCGIDGDLYEVSKRSVDGPTKFCMIGELHQRKDPFLAIQAFHQLKVEHGDAFDAELHLKAANVTLPQELTGVIDGLYVYNEYWQYKKLIDWMHSMHCYVGPSRGEGNLKPPMEFMATGGTVIATFWSGPTNWLIKEAGYPLDFQLLAMDREDGPREAYADLDHLKELMFHVHTHRQEARDKGQYAADWIRWSSDWNKIIPRFIESL